MQLVRGAWESLLQTVYPPVCFACPTPMWGHEPAWLCEACLEKLTPIDPRPGRTCGFCGASLRESPELERNGGEGAVGHPEPANPPHPSGPRGCPHCAPARQAYTRALGTVRYAPPGRDLVHALKFSGRRRVAAPMAAMMADRLQAWAASTSAHAFDLIIPVPLHPRRMGERGFNQSDLLARGIARRLDRPLASAGLRRTRYTQPQSSLTGEARKRNLVNAFAPVGAMPPRVLLVDDVMTTGSTVSECARALRGAGAERVYVIVFAR